MLNKAINRFPYNLIIIYTPNCIYKYTFQFHEALVYEFKKLQINSISMTNMDDLKKIIKDNKLLLILLGDPSRTETKKVLFII